MNKKLKIIGSALLCILGWLMGGIGFAEPLPYGLNTPFFILGILLMPLGFVLFIVYLKK